MKVSPAVITNTSNFSFYMTYLFSSVDKNNDTVFIGFSASDPVVGGRKRGAKISLDYEVGKEVWKKMSTKLTGSDTSNGFKVSWEDKLDKDIDKYRCIFTITNV